MPSPPKPWEKANGTVTSSNVTMPSRTDSLGPTTTIADAAAPTIPPRPSMNGFAGNLNRGYNNYGTGYSSGYSPYSYSGMNSYSSYGAAGYSPYNRYGSYSSYSPYNRYGYSSYNSYGSYGSPYSRYTGYGGGIMGPGVPGVPESLTQRMEANTAAGFHMIESVVNAFGGFASMLESTFFATHSSFMAMVGVVEQFGNLRNYLGQILSIFALARWMRNIFYKITGRAPSSNPDDLTLVNFEQFQETTRYSRRPLIFFVLAVFGIPYLMQKLIQILSRRREAQINKIPPPGDSRELSLQAPTSISPQNLEFCRALYDFRGETSAELSFQKGDIIAVLNKVTTWEQWWFGRLRSSEQGMFPSNYVEIINKGGGSPDTKQAREILPPTNDVTKKTELNVQEFKKNEMGTV